MSDLIPYGKQFEKIVDIIESAKERAYQKVNERELERQIDSGYYERYMLSQKPLPPAFSLEM